jgi:hypothetical protein
VALLFQNMYEEMKILIVASVMFVLLATVIAHSPTIQSVYSQGTISQIMLEKYKVLFPTRIHLSLSQQLLQQKMENSQSYYPEIS